MKRSPLRRLTPLRRVGFKRKWKPLPPDEQAVLDQFKDEFKTCWRCGEDGTVWHDNETEWFLNELQTHHIARLRRWHVRENLARLCLKCHGLYHDGNSKERFDIDDVIALKRLHDPSFYDAGALLELLRPGSR